jgi:SAM-dependent methyltransferase
MPNCELRPADAYPRNQYPKLRRITDSPVNDCYVRNYLLSAKAAGAVEIAPQILLHSLLYHGNHEGFVHYADKERSFCSIRKVEKLDALGHRKAAEEITVVTPGELSDTMAVHQTGLYGHYPALFLPSDIEYCTKSLQNDVSMNTIGSFFPAIYVESDPFNVYRVFQYVSLHSDLLRGIKRTLDVGSGLGTVGFVASRFLDERAEVDGIEINAGLVEGAEKVRQALIKDFGHDLSRVGFYEGDILSPRNNVNIADYDAVTGYFPLGFNVGLKELLPVFSRMKPGALLFQMVNPFPFTAIDVPEGFKLLEFEDPIPGSVFQRV